MKMKRLLAAVLLAVCLPGMTAALAEQTGSLTPADATDIALARAERSAADVFLTQLSQDRDDGRLVYEVEFIADGKEYEYDIDAQTGEILKESMKTASERKRGMDVSLYLPLEDALAKALAQAGVTAEAAVLTEAEFDFDDGRAEYEFQFTADGRTYEVELDAQSGEILKYEVKSGDRKR